MKHLKHAKQHKAKHTAYRFWVVVFVFLNALFYTASSHATLPFSFGGDGEVTIVDIEVDREGSLVVLGTYTEDLSLFDTEGELLITLPVTGNQDLFVLKFDGSGKFIWATRSETIGSMRPNALSIDAEGTIAIGGEYTAETFFNELRIPSPTYRVETGGGSFIEYDINIPPPFSPLSTGYQRLKRGGFIATLNGKTAEWSTATQLRSYRFTSSSSGIDSVSRSAFVVKDIVSSSPGEFYVAGFPSILNRNNFNSGVFQFNFDGTRTATDPLESTGVKFESAVASTILVGRPDPDLGQTVLPFFQIPGSGVVNNLSFEGVKTGRSGRVVISGLNNDFTYDTRLNSCNETDIPPLHPFVAQVRKIGSEFECRWVKLIDRNSFASQRSAIAIDRNPARGFTYFYSNGRLYSYLDDGNTAPLHDFTEADDFLIVSQPENLGDGKVSLFVAEDGGIIVVGSYKNTIRFVTKNPQNPAGPALSESDELPFSQEFTPFVAKRNISGEWEWAIAPSFDGITELPAAANLPAIYSNPSAAFNESLGVYLADAFSTSLDFHNTSDSYRVENGPVTAGLEFEGSQSLSVNNELLDGETEFTLAFEVTEESRGTILSAQDKELEITLDEDHIRIFDKSAQGEIQLTFARAPNQSNVGVQFQRFVLHRGLSFSAGNPVVNWQLQQFEGSGAKPKQFKFPFPSRSLSLSSDPIKIGAAIAATSSSQNFNGFLTFLALGEGNTFAQFAAENYIATSAAYWKFGHTSIDLDSGDLKIEDLSPNDNDILLTNSAEDPEVSLLNSNPQDSSAYVALIDQTNGEWISDQVWTLGQEIVAPNGVPDQQPQVEIACENGNESQFIFWSQLEGKLFATGLPDCAVIITWNTDVNNNGQQVVRVGKIVPPRASGRETHVSGAPVFIDPAVNMLSSEGSESDDVFLSFSSVVWSSDQEPTAVASNDFGSDGWVFKHTLQSGNEEGYAVLRYLKIESPDEVASTLSNESYYMVVRTVNGHSVAEEKDAAIGTALVDERHQAPEPRNGFVVNPTAPYDGEGARRAHDRDQRTGPIIPVNTPQSGEEQHQMLVAWYQASNLGTSIFWPSIAVRYTPQWPDNPDKTIIISSLKGSGPIEDVIGTGANSLHVYRQADQTKAGFNPNEEHSLLANNNNGESVFYALRDDLNDIDQFSEAYALLKYRKPGVGWSIEVFKVCATPNARLCQTTPNADDIVFGPSYTDPDDAPSDPFVVLAGERVTAPAPLNRVGACVESNISSDPLNAGWEDYQGNLWARADNRQGGASNRTVFRYYYPLKEEFFLGMPGERYIEDAEIGTCIPWLPPEDDVSGVPIATAYEFRWPEDTAEIVAGQTIYKPASDINGLSLPPVKGSASLEIIYDELAQGEIATVGSGREEYNKDTPRLLRLLDVVSERRVSLAGLGAVNNIAQRGDKIFFLDLPSTLRPRLFFDPNAQELGFRGILNDEVIGDTQILPNIMTAAERGLMQQLILNSDGIFRAAIESLYQVSRNPNGLAFGIDGAPNYDVEADQDSVSNVSDLGRIDLGNEGAVRFLPQRLHGVPNNMVLDAEVSNNSGFVTIAINNIAGAQAEVDLHVIRVNGDKRHRGNVWSVPSDNIFETALTLRHTGLFAGEPDPQGFEWYFQPDNTGQPTAPASAPPLPWTKSDSTGINVTLDGANISTFADNWFVVNYSDCAFAADCNWAGAPASASPIKAQLAVGWLKRVVNGLNPFDSRVSDFHNNEASTISSLIQQIGAPYQGDVALNPDGANVNSIGLIEAYQTVLNRARSLSIDADQPISSPALDTQLLNVSTRIGDLFTALGNEADADAADPTIGITSSDALGQLASSLFSFKNQVAAPIEEELVLLRGRDGSRTGTAGAPVFNRFFWNFTQGDGEVAYVQAYDIVDTSNNDGLFDGFINEADARRRFPMGHGDAWGHYLSATKTRYNLLKNENFTWIPRTESVPVNGATVQVDYFDERRFAIAAAAKAKVGADIVNLTYRQQYVEDPNGQWQGYKDLASERAWGLDGWARRAGQGAYFDWLTLNALLPASSEVIEETDIRRIDRGTVPEIALISSSYADIQGQVDIADAGLNPVGLAKGTVPFDIDPNFNEVGSGNQGQAHFEQILERAEVALQNAAQLFDFANQQSQSIRAQQDDADQITQAVTEQEVDFKNQLLELYGYPYANDPDFVGKRTEPDIYHTNYISSDLIGTLPTPDQNLTGFFTASQFGSRGVSFFLTDEIREVSAASGDEIKEVSFPIATGADWPFVAPKEWGKRQAVGDIQLAISDYLQNKAALQRSIIEHKNLLDEIKDQADLLLQEYQLATDTIRITRGLQQETRDLNISLATANTVSLIARGIVENLDDTTDSIIESVPRVVGFSNDPSFALRGATRSVNTTITKVISDVADLAEISTFGLEAAKEDAALRAEIALAVDTPFLAAIQVVKVIEQMWRQEAVLRLELFTQSEVVLQSLGRYKQLLAKGERLKDELRAFRASTAGEVQQNRYKDVTFRILRNEALQKYRSQFELAVRYAYLAATAYDYETNLLSDSNGSGEELLAEIVRQRSVGLLVDGVPQAGSPGLADILARLRQNYQVYEGQLGFNNPQFETNRFSIRQESQKLLSKENSQNERRWRSFLENSRVDDLWQVPEFRRFARPFAPESLGAQPGIVIDFQTAVEFGLNFFANTLSGGDSSYDPTNFATKIRSAGVWFADYDNTALSNTPRVYLIPTGKDRLRAPDDDNFEFREWQVIDQKMPVPFPIGQTALNDPDWQPRADSLSDNFGEIRRFSSLRAYPDNGLDSFDPSEVSADSRLIGRSVANTQWKIIIPGGTFLNDPDEGLDTLIYGRLLPGAIPGPGGNCINDPEEGSAISPCRDGNGISDIRLFFSTYGYSGN